MLRGRCNDPLSDTFMRTWPEQGRDVQSSNGKRTGEKTSNGSVTTLVSKRTPDLRFVQNGVSSGSPVRPDATSRQTQKDSRRKPVQAHAELPAPFREHVQVWEREATLAAKLRQARKERPGDEVVPGLPNFVLGRPGMLWQERRKQEQVVREPRVGRVLLFVVRASGVVVLVDPFRLRPQPDDRRRVERALPGFLRRRLTDVR